MIDRIGTSSSATAARQHWRLLIDFIMHPICTPGLYSRWYSSIATAPRDDSGRHLPPSYKLWTYSGGDGTSTGWEFEALS